MQVIKALADETRIRMINILRGGDLCVCELETILNINQSNASRHLVKLTNADILKFYKVAKYVYYKINQDALSEFPFLKDIIEKETAKLKMCLADNERLAKYRNSGLSCDDLKVGKSCFK
ncbi:metalloregulator ArsR/SmtB family transcription factor [Oxobacter pfennigii]